ncbi:hypothetical protein GLYMA_07G220350v4 [Glycine max]|nr:hypothetical protein GLYMA_07G220350v4 [Glycine max]KAH1088036.1 hypothetical protein GYH30_019207 [Glycine max]
MLLCSCWSPSLSYSVLSLSLSESFDLLCSSITDHRSMPPLSIPEFSFTHSFNYQMCCVVIGYYGMPAAAKVVKAASHVHKRSNWSKLSWCLEENVIM